MTPGDLAAVDQAVADFSGDVDKIVTAAREQIAQHGRDQALCNVALYLVDYADLNRESMAALLTVAVMRLAEQPAVTS